MNAQPDEWLTELSFCAAAPDAQALPGLARQARYFAETTAALGRPALKLLFASIARELERPQPDLTLCSDAGLAAVELLNLRDPEPLGLAPALIGISARAGLSAAQARGLLRHLLREQGDATPAPAPALTQAEPNTFDVPGKLAPALKPAGRLEPEPRDRALLRYISPEERELLIGALEGDLLAELATFSVLPETRSCEGELHFLLGSLANALDAVGLPATAGALKSQTIALDAPGNAATDGLCEWLVLLLGWFTDPIAASVEELTGVSPVSLQLALKSELAHVEFAHDPALLAARGNREFTEEDLQLAPAEDVIPSVLQGMLRELPGHADVLTRSIAGYAQSGDRIALDQARRTAHTLKGDANTVGIRGLALLTHALEDILVELDKRGGEREPTLVAILAEAADCVAAMADAVLSRGDAPADAGAILTRVYAAADALDRGETAEVAASHSKAPNVSKPAAQAEPLPPSAAPIDASEPDELLSVPRRLLDRLLEASSEAVALANQLKNEIDALGALRAELHGELELLARGAAALDEQVSLRGHSLELSKRQSAANVDPLELEQYNELYLVSRRLTEAHADARARLLSVDQGVGRIDALSRQNGRVSDALNQDVQRARLVRISEVSGRFERTVRQAARTLDKSVQFVIAGDQLAIDKVMLDALIEPLMHLLRNAVDHGLESNEQRARAGKPVQGEVKLAFSQSKLKLNVSLSDDGGGLDYERIAARGRELGVIDDDESPEADFLKTLVFLPGFSTRDEVSQMSGRGVGMDVVARRIQSLGGSIELHSEKATGTRVELALPMALGTLKVAVLTIAGETLALACDSFERFIPLSADDQRFSDTGIEASVDGDWLPALDGGRLFGLNAVLTSAQMVSRTGLLLTVPGEGRRVILVDAVDTLVTTVLKNLDRQLKPIRGIRGATVLGDGRAAAVIDVRELARARRGDLLDALPDFEAAIEMAPRVLVVDDSLTVRRSLGELLEDSGYSPELARDGLEALVAIERKAPRALLVDLEMPRMNGLELTMHLRRTPAFEHLPIIMITSRTAELHMQMARDAGVTDVLSKPYSEEELLNLLAAAIDNAYAFEEVRR